MTLHVGPIAICPSTRKFGFESRRVAKRKLREWQGRGNASFTSQSVYRCPSCGRWHLSSYAKRPAA